MLCPITFKVNAHSSHILQKFQHPSHPKPEKGLKEKVLNWAHKSTSLTGFVNLKQTLACRANRNDNGPFGNFAGIKMATAMCGTVINYKTSAKLANLTTKLCMCAWNIILLLAWALEALKMLRTWFLKIIHNFTSPPSFTFPYPFLAIVS